jgi:hypothetical protein
VEPRALAPEGRRDLSYGLNVFEIAKQDGIPTYRAADRLAERRIAAVRRW